MKTITKFLENEKKVLNDHMSFLSNRKQTCIKEIESIEKSIEDIGVKINEINLAIKKLKK